MSWATALVEYFGYAPKTISSIGLLFDLVGITILFFFQVDRNHQLSPEAIPTLALGNGDPEGQKTWAIYRKLTVLGFVLLIVGFGLQLLGNLAA